MNDDTMKFYCRYVDDKLLIVDPQDISCIHKLLNDFVKTYNLPLICLKMNFHNFLTWKCHHKIALLEEH